MLVVAAFTSLDFRVQDVWASVQGLWLGVQGSGFRVQGSGFWVLGVWLMISPP